MATPSQLEKGEKLPIPTSGSAEHLLRSASPSASAASPPIVTRLGCWARASAVKRAAIALIVFTLVSVGFQQVSCRLHLKHICPRPPQIEFILPAEDHFVFDTPSLYSPDPLLDTTVAEELKATWAAAETSTLGGDQSGESESLYEDAGLEARPMDSGGSGAVHVLEGTEEGAWEDLRL